jgi:protocatechuate 3,4-dioxygenase beta subunit
VRASIVAAPLLREAWMTRPHYRAAPYRIALIAVAACLVAIDAPRTWQGPPGPGHATISGTVRAADTGLPLRDAEVRLGGGPLKTPRGVFTDAQGRYRFEDIAPGKYTLSASKLGYARTGHGQDAAPGEPKPLVVEGLLEGIDFRLVRAGVIVVQVMDHYGEPLAGATVNVFRAGPGADTRKLVSASEQGFPGFPTTDDRGEVRMFNLAPGPYFVTAKRFVSPSRSARPNSSEFFYPGTLSIAEAQPVHVASGQDLPIVLPLLEVRPAQIAGAIVTSYGAPYTNPQLSLINVTGAGSATHPVSMGTAGKFEAAQVPPGKYLIQIRPTGEPAEFANHEIQVVGEDIRDLVVITRPPATLRGQIVFDDPERAPRPGADNPRILTRYIGHTVSPGRLSVASDWTFQVSDILGTGRFVVEDRTGTWFLEGVWADGEDGIDQQLDFASLEGKSLELRLTSSPAVISGTVADDRGAPVSDYVVVAFSEDPARWHEYSRYVMSARPDQHGRFTLTALPPGAYHVAALRTLDRGAEFSPVFLRTVQPRAVRQILEKGSSVTLRLVLATGSR